MVNNTRVKSAERVVDILEALAEWPGGVGVSDLARRLGIPKSSTWNLVRTLLQRRYLEQLPAGRFVLGARLFDVGVCARADTRLQTVARPVMAELAEQTGETVFLGILTPDFEVLQLDKIVSPHVIRYDADLGQPRPAHCTAIGKALLAQLPPEQLDYYFRTKKRVRVTPHTVTERRALLAQLAEVRRTGVAFNIEERVPGGSAVGAPIFAGSGRPIAGIIVAGPTNRVLVRRAELARSVREAAARISRGLEARGVPAGGAGAGPARTVSGRGPRAGAAARATAVGGPPPVPGLPSAVSR